jgi:hypothetical protein
MRYATVADLAADIRRHLARKAGCRASPYSWLSREVSGQAEWITSRDERGCCDLCWPEFCSRFGLVLNKLLVRQQVCSPGKPRTAEKYCSPAIRKPG